MDRMTPLDLERVQLPTAWRGYHRESVDRLLASLAAQLGEMLAEAQTARRRFEDAERTLATYQGRERALVDAVTLAQKAADDARANARREAELIVQEANVEAQEIRQKATESAASVQWEIERLRQEKTNLEARLRATLLEHLDRLDAQGRAVIEVAPQEAATG